MANYQNVENFFNDDNLLDSQHNQIVPIRFVRLESDSDGNPYGLNMVKWKPDSAGLVPTTLAEIDFNNGDFETTITLANGNYARINIHPNFNSVLGLEDGGTMKTTLYAEDGTIIRDGATNPFPASSNTAINWTPVNREYYVNGAKLVLANYHRAGKYMVDGVMTETTFGYNFGFAIIPKSPEFEEGTYYPIPGSISPMENSEIPLHIDPIATCPSAADLINVDPNVNDWEQFIADCKVPKEDEPDPEEEGRSAQEGESDGGNRNFPTDDGHSDNILPSDVPTEQVANTGMYGVWHLYAGDVRVLSNFLWSDDFYDNVIKNFVSPLDNIISFGLVPFTGFSESTQPFQICNVQVKSGGANYSALRVTRNLYRLDCGSVSMSDIGRLENNFTDYEPYTKYWIYLPFIGTVDLPCDDVARNGKVQVQYKFDIISGACVAELITYTASSGWNITGRYSGNILTTYPLSGVNYMQMYQQLAASSLGVIGGVMTENVAAVAGSMMSAVASKPQYTRGGNVSNVAGLLTSTRRPVIIKAQPNAFEATRFKNLHGYKSNLDMRVGDAAGFISGSVNQIKLSGIGRATQSELDEIQMMLGSGIYTA